MDGFVGTSLGIYPSMALMNRALLVSPMISLMREFILIRPSVDLVDIFLFVCALFSQVGLTIGAGPLMIAATSTCLTTCFVVCSMNVPCS
jgi:hypothetical protein